MKLSLLDLNTLSIDDDLPPPVPPRDRNMMAEIDVSQSLGGYLQSGTLIRSGSEHSLLTQSVCMAESTSKFHPGTKLRAGMLPLRRGSLNPLMDKSVIPKSPKKSDKNIFRSKKSKKKSDTFGGRGTPTNSAMASPARSSTMMFNHSPSHTSSLSSSVNMGGGGGASGVSISLSASFNSGDSKCKKSRWKLLQNKVGRKFNKTNIAEEEEEEMPRGSRAQRSNSSPSMRKFGVNRNYSITDEDFRVGSMGDGSGVISPRSRRASSSQQGCNGKVLAKIFSILNVWVDQYYEVRLCASPTDMNI